MRNKTQAKGCEAKASYRGMQLGGGSLLLTEDTLLGIQLFLGYKPTVRSYRI